VNPELVARSLPSIGLVATMGLFLPSLDEAWKCDPTQPSMFHVKLRRGETLYVSIGATVLLLASYANRTTLPILIGGGFMLATVMTYEQAYRAIPPEHATT
jgi:hypothetical protein